MTDADESFLRALRAFEGRSVGPPADAPDAVNQAMIRHWAEAMGDENPVYVDEAAARANGFPGVIAPPTMLQAWVMRGYRASIEAEATRARRAGASAPAPPAEGTAAAGSRPGPSAQDELLGLLDGAGFTSVVATNCEQRYGRPLVLGDRLTVSSTIESVSERKATGLGDGHFVTTRLDFTDAAGEPVATMRFRILKFRPRPKPDVQGSSAQATVSPDAASPAPAGATGAQRQAGAAPVAPRPRRPRPAITPDIAFFFDGTRAGRLLIQRCASCGALRHPPLPSCPSCRSLDWDTVEVSGRGSVYSFVVVHHPQIPAFDYPLPIALVELDEGVRLVGDLIGVDPADVCIGMPVTVELVAVDDELTLPMFRPAAPSGGEDG